MAGEDTCQGEWKITEANAIKNAEAKIDHFAFNVTQEDFEAAKLHFEKIGQAYQFQDHIYFHSIYAKDPDGHTIELTTIVTDENNIYQ